MTNEDVADAVGEILEDMQGYEWARAQRKLEALFEELTLTPGDIKEENDGFWWKIRY